MKHQIKEIVQELTELINDQLTYLENHVIPLDDEDLEWRPSKYKWNIFEVLEHIIRFNEFYLPKFRQIVSYPKSSNKKKTYRSGYFGRIAIKRARPVNGVVVNKVKAPSKTNPFLRKLGRSVIHEYIDQQHKLLELIGDLDEIDLSKNYMPTVVGNWLKLNFGDSVRLLVHHEERHFVQIDDLVNKRTDT